MEEKVLDMLVEVCEDEDVKEDLDIDLFESGLLDSLAVAELLVNIEEVFGIELPLTELDRNMISTPNKLIAFLKEKGAN